MEKSINPYKYKNIKSLIFLILLFFIGCTESSITQPDLISIQPEFELLHNGVSDCVGGGDLCDLTDVDLPGGGPEEPCPPNELCDNDPGTGDDSGDPGTGTGGAGSEGEPEAPCPDDQLCDVDTAD